ncbi:hypothetical protein J2S58_002692 [Nakamurella flavida]|nr:hypothetical protein [Nakamurella flavida]
MVGTAMMDKTVTECFRCGPNPVDVRLMAYDPAWTRGVGRTVRGYVVIGRVRTVFGVAPTAGRGSWAASGSDPGRSRVDPTGNRWPAMPSDAA